MGQDDETTAPSADDPDRTVDLDRDDLVPPPPPPDPIDPAELRRAATPRADAVDDGRDRGRGGGLVWIGVVVALTLAFVAACYLIVARAERDRDTGPVDVTTTEASTTTGPTTTAAAPPATHDPASLTVAVLNGTEQRGWAGENAAALAEAGFATTTTDAIDSPDTTTIYTARDDLAADAAAVAALIGLPDAPVEPRPEDPLASSSSDQDADLVVVLGADSLADG